MDIIGVILLVVFAYHAGKYVRTREFLEGKSYPVLNGEPYVGIQLRSLNEMRRELAQLKGDSGGDSCDNNADTRRKLSENSIQYISEALKLLDRASGKFHYQAATQLAGAVAALSRTIQTGDRNDLDVGIDDLKSAHVSMGPMEDTDLWLQIGAILERLESLE